ncbi:MAG TPA: TonB-dependent receptor [Hyphomicrobiales bacterium]|nr:TonB-dependent receptor [Hyphomicrobiales bacterium]
MHRHLPRLLSLSPLALATSIALAQPVEEIIVTADFRQGALDDIPGSITVLDADLIEKRNARHLEDLLLNAPNVNLAGGASRARFYQLRGIGETGQFTEPLNPSVGMLIDGVDFSGISTSALLYDTEQVEILMGPQGTRYGSNALAGLINVQSRRPTQEFSYGLELGAENYDGLGVGAYVSGAVTDTLSLRLSGQHQEGDGYMKNRFLDRPTNNRDEDTLRLGAHWQAGAATTLDLTLAQLKSDNGYDAFSLDNTRDTWSDQPGQDTQDARLMSLRLRHEGFSGVTLEGYLGLARSDTGYSYDEDWVYQGFHPDEYSSSDAFTRNHDSASAELRLLSTDTSRLFDGRTSWVVGLYGLRQDTDLVREYTYLPAPFTSAYATRRTALYADTSTELTARLSLDLGLRYEHYEADYHDNAALQFAPADDLGGGRLALNYHLDDDVLLYASLARGYKTGGFNMEGSLDADLREYATETLWNYEFGIKGSLLDNALQVRAALFWMDRRDVQISSSTVRMREDGSAEFIDYVGNAADGYNRGLELNLQYFPTEALQFYANLGLLDTEYQDFINSVGDDLSGRDQAHAPRYQYTTGVSWQLQPALSLDVNVQGRAAFYFSDSHPSRSKAYDLLNASLRWQHDDWRLTFWGRNLTNQDYAVRGYYFGNDPRDGYQEHTYVQLGEPRRFGVTLNLDF